MSKLTQRQKDILDCISKSLDEKGYPPSVREIAFATGIKSTRGVTINLDALEREGYIQRDATARSIKVITPQSQVKTRMIPLVGDIAAGDPILASERMDEVIPVPDILTSGSEDAIVLRVQGDSMTEDGIFDGDLVVVRRQPIVENGELAAVIIEGEATVKRFYREADKVRLKPANPQYEPIIVSLQESQTIIAGKVIGLLRSYR